MAASTLLLACLLAPPPEPVGPEPIASPSPAFASAPGFVPSVPPPRPEDPFDVELAIDLPVIALTGSVYLGAQLAARELAWKGCHGCDPSRLGPLDRRVLDNHVRGAGPASHALLGTSLALPIVADLGDVLGHRTGIRGWGEDVVVLVESASVGAALNAVVKLAVGRPRPFTYGLDGSGRDPTTGEARLSFYSLHASTAFAMATAYGYLFTARHPRSRWVAPVWIAGYAVAGTTGVLRVAAGQHFWSDVIVGAIAGTAVGVAIPAAHRLSKAPIRARRRARASVTSDGASTMIRLDGAF